MLAVIIHYEMLYRLSVIIPRLKIRYRFRVLCGVLGTSRPWETCAFWPVSRP